MNSQPIDDDPVVSHATKTGNRRPRRGVTDEVGDEGGTPGDLELDRTASTGGSEATSTVATEPTETVERHRDESGEGRRSP